MLWLQSLSKSMEFMQKREIFGNVKYSKFMGTGVVYPHRLNMNNVYDSLSEICNDTSSVSFPFQILVELGK